MISVYNYMDPIDFITDYIRFEKNNNTHFSIRKLSKSLELNSTAPLLDVLKRKKPLKGKVLQGLLQQLPIDKSELMYFQAINERSLAKSEEKVTMYDLLLNELRPHFSKDEVYICKRELDLFSHWIYMAILSLSRIPGFSLHSKNIQNKLKEKLDIGLINDSISKLVEGGLLLEDEQGQLKRVYSSHSTKTDFKSKDVDKYYEMVSDLAVKAISQPLEEREFQCFSMAIDQKNIKLAKEIIRKTRRQLANLASEGSPDSVYQVNLMMFSLTENESES
jgi:uncharacterized protein (TIGR02147 family)